MVNTGTNDIVVNFSFDSPVDENVFATTLGGPSLNASNTIDNPNLIAPSVSSFSIPNTSAFNYTFGAQTVTVLSLSVVDW